VTAEAVTLLLERRGEIGKADVNGLTLNLSEVEELHFCTVTPVQCELTHAALLQLAGKGLLATPSLTPDESLKMYVSVLVGEGVMGEVADTATVAGGIEESEEGGGPPSEVSVTRGTLVEGAAGFGLNVFDTGLPGVDGVPDVQAGGHPFEFHTVFGLNAVRREGPEGAAQTIASVQDLRDVVVDLPLGLSGSGVLAAQCTLAQLSSRGERQEQGRSGCPTDTIVGSVRTYPEALDAAASEIYNLVPEHGVAAEFGFIDLTGGTHVLYVSLAPTPAGYVIRTASRELPAVALNEILVNIFGDPAARDKSGETPVAAFTNPEFCSGEPLKTTIYMDSWQAPGPMNADGTPDLADSRWVASTAESPAVSGCELLKGLFTPSITAGLSTGSSGVVRADSPAGLEVDVSVPQHEEVEGLSTPALRNTTITLPVGLSVNPSSVNGLAACSEAQVGWLGKSPVATGEYENFTPKVLNPDSGRYEATACPDGSKIGTVELETPALAMQVCEQTDLPVRDCPAGEVVHSPLRGSIFVAKQSENPFGSLLAIYIVIDDPRTGVIAKIPGEVTPDANTGQLTTTVPDTPQFPFSVLRTRFFEGPTAALSTPLTCGTLAISSVLTPWSSPGSGPAASPKASLSVNQDATGGTCAPPVFAPTLEAGTANNKAGAYSPFSVTFARQDGEEAISGVSVKMPLGLLGTIRGIPLCEAAQAATGDCPQASLLGEATVAVGTGPEPYWVRGGKVYLTGPYNNGPFGLSILVPTAAGPFTLTGNAGFGREVVRASIRVDPHTEQITVVSDPLPTILEGIPLKVKAVNVTVNRPDFTFNPTNCNRLQAEATFSSSEGATATTSAPFYATGCASLPFTPTVTASTSAKTSRVSGASLTVHVAYPKVPQGTDANIAKVHVELPKSLPSRLSTLQKACPAATFENNPADCSQGSIVGHALVHTQTLPVPLTGPAYFVSHGGAQFPELIIVLQGYGITVDLHGETFINEKTNVTSSTFKQVPDVPFETFELNLPEGPNSALAAIGNLCSQHLVLPTQLTGQNGAELNQQTPIEVEGCPNTLSVVSEKVKGNKVTLKVVVPAGGKLSASGKGLKGSSKSASGRETITITVPKKKAGKLVTKIKLSFKPKKGKQLSKTVTAKFKH
jgi:hypothetical protein